MYDWLAPRVQVQQPVEQLQNDGLCVPLGQRSMLAKELGERAAVAVGHDGDEGGRVDLEDGERLDDPPVAHVDRDVDLALDVAHKGLLAHVAPLLGDVVELARRVRVQLEVVRLEDGGEAPLGDQVEEDEAALRRARGARRGACRAGLDHAAVEGKRGAVAHARLELVEILVEPQLVKVLLRA